MSLKKTQPMPKRASGGNVATAATPSRESQDERHWLNAASARVRPPQVERRTREPRADQRRRQSDRREPERGRRRQAAADREGRDESNEAIAGP